MRRFAACLLLAACGSPSDPATTPDAPATPDAAIDSASPSGFGELSGMCGVLGTPDLTGASPELIRATMTFARRYVDPDDRPLLTVGGQHLAETPNAGGSSGLSEIFAYEELARCEHAALLKTETEIVYDTMGKITDLEVSIGQQKIGVSVTRAQTYPLGTPYTESAATTLIMRKLNDIKASTANVSAADRWTKQVLAVLAWDTQAADTVAHVWSMLPADVKADTIVVVTTTNGDDTFIYTNQ
ncbi:MAG TPA: hypothetical protein VMZ53_27370 [Kofleriaceae bacterium]|nr:hypothetical protein [Kofleriaceae bacterium]